MPITRQDVENLIETFVDWCNDQAIWCAKDAEGTLIVIDGILQLEVQEWDSETNSFKFKGEYRPWKETKPEEIFVYCYAYDSHGERIEELLIEEQYIENLSNTAIIVRDTETKTSETAFTMLPLDRIDLFAVGA
jgi:hypothetical protein